MRGMRRSRLCWGRGIAAERAAARGPRRLVRHLAAVLWLAFLCAGCSDRDEAWAPRAADGWYEFTGTWNASGTRRGMALGDGRQAALVDLQGTMLLAGPGRPGVGFRAETIALVDSRTGLVGRAVWTDEAGDRVFSDLVGEGTAARNHIEGTVVGGTGRFVGATGSYGFSWEYVLEGEGGRVQGRAVDLKGRLRVGEGPR